MKQQKKRKAIFSTPMNDYEIIYVNQYWVI